MIRNDQEFHVTLQRVAQFQQQIEHLRQTEADPETYHASASGFIAEIDRMNVEVREYLSLHPSELQPTGRS